MLVCKHNRYTAVPCEGAKGCTMDGTTARCDFSGNKVGSDCDDKFIGKRMCKDAKTSLACLNGKFQAQICGGPNGCVAKTDGEGGVQDCDTSLAKEGDTCDRTFTTKPACDTDGKQILECTKENRFQFVRFCRGPKGCVSEKGTPNCDNSVAELGDPCFPPVPHPCSKDGVAMLLCDGTKMFEKMCPGPDGCSTNDKGEAMCDQRPPVDGGLCTKKGQQACQAPKDAKDKGALLECNGTKYTVKKRCTNQCAFTRPDKFECK
jgi:hypothetical protein